MAEGVLVTKIKNPGTIKAASFFDAGKGEGVFSSLREASRSGFKVDGLAEDEVAELGVGLFSSLRETGLLREGLEFDLKRRLRNDPEAFLNKADADWRDRLLMTSRTIGQRYAELKMSGLPDSAIKKYMRAITQAELSGQRILHEAKFGSENLREAERIVKVRKGVKIAAKGSRKGKEKVEEEELETIEGGED